MMMRPTSALCASAVRCARTVCVPSLRRWAGVAPRMAEPAVDAARVAQVGVWGSPAFEARRGLWTAVAPLDEAGEGDAEPAPADDAEAAAGAGEEAGEGEGDGEGEGEDEHDPRATLEEQTKSDEELAKNNMYFELLVHYWQENEELPWYRIDELQSTEKFVMVANRFASMRAHVPELFDGLEEKGKFTPEAVAALDGGHLSTLAWAYATAGHGSDELFNSIAEAAKTTELAAHEAANVEWALSKRA